MSDHERIAQVAQRKWATMSESLRSLKTNEQPWAIRSGRSEEMSDLLKKFWLKKTKILFLVCFIYCTIKKNIEKWANRSFLLISYFLVNDVSDRERIAQVAHQKWANEWITHFFERIAHSLIFGQKTSDSLGKPMSEFPALAKSIMFLYRSRKGWLLGHKKLAYKKEKKLVADLPMP